MNLCCFYFQKKMLNMYRQTKSMIFKRTIENIYYIKRNKKKKTFGITIDANKWQDMPVLNLIDIRQCLHFLRVASPFMTCQVFLWWYRGFAIVTFILVEDELHSCSCLFTLVFEWVPHLDKFFFTFVHSYLFSIFVFYPLVTFQPIFSPRLGHNNHIL